VNKIDSNIIKEHILHFYKENGKSPTMRDVRKLFPFHDATVTRHFGSMNNCLKALGLPTNKECKEGNITTITFTCPICNMKVTKKVKMDDGFESRTCSRKCGIKHLNRRRSQFRRDTSILERWIHEQLDNIYETPNILYNDRVLLQGLELDIYIPEYKIAFELNGRHHYSPIFGIERLTSTQNNDRRKIQKCKQLGISLYVIDTSKLRKFSNKKAKYYLSAITCIIGA